MKSHVAVLLAHPPHLPLRVLLSRGARWVNQEESGGGVCVGLFGINPKAPGAIQRLCGSGLPGA
jgi:hypothetical protein